MIQLVECPRDAMQGIHTFIDSSHKVEYINQLLKVGFHTIDFGSFVSPRAIPQMRDTAYVINNLNKPEGGSKLLAIVANLRGAKEASSYNAIDCLGYPFSISETFQQRNTNASIEESLKRVDSILEICQKHNKELVIYISMGFGNPYGDDWSEETVLHWVEKLAEMGIQTMSLSDTVGVAKPDRIAYLFRYLCPAFPEVLFGAHLHTRYDDWFEKVDAAYANGCKRFDGAIRGLGGCPMATDTLTGNMPTEHLITYFENKKIDLGLDKQELMKANQLALQVFP